MSKYICMECGYTRLRPWVICPQCRDPDAICMPRRDLGVSPGMISMGPQHYQPDSTNAKRFTYRLPGDPPSRYPGIPAGCVCAYRLQGERWVRMDVRPEWGCPAEHEDGPVPGGPPMREGNNPRTGIAYNE